MIVNDSGPPKPKRRWYQFSLRRLLIAVLVLGVFLGWITSRLQRARKNREAVAAVEKVVTAITESGGMVVRRRGRRSPAWLEDLFDDPEIGRAHV